MVSEAPVVVGAVVVVPAVAKTRVVSWHSDMADPRLDSIDSPRVVQEVAVGRAEVRVE